MKHILRLFCICVIPACITQTLFAQSSLIVNPDNTFGTNGSVVLANPPNQPYNYAGVGNCMAIQTDGKILIGGKISQIAVPFVGRYLSNGALDTTFGVKGFSYPYPAISGQVTSINLLSNGSILICGQYDSTNIPKCYISKLTKDGIVDSTFGTYGYTYVSNATNSSLLVLSDGSLVLGYQSPSGYNGGYSLIKTNSAGVTDATFGTAGTVTVAQLATQSVTGITLCQGDGILVSGSMANNYSNGSDTVGLVRYLSNGSIDNSYGQNGLVTFHFTSSNTNFHLRTPVPVVQPDNSVVVSLASGYYQFSSAIHVLANGNLDLNYGKAGLGTYLSNPELSGSSPTSAILTFNQEVLCASISSFSSTADGFLSAMNVNGVADTLSFPVMTGLWPFSLKTYSGNQLFVASNNSFNMGVISLRKFIISVSPLIIQSFSVQKQPDSTALLSWSTATEHNVNHYEIRRSADSINWQTIATVPAVGNSNTLSNYSYKDSFPNNGPNYYRIKMIGNDGTYTYSNQILSANFSFSTPGCTAPSAYVYQITDTTVTIKLNTSNALYYQYAYIPIVNPNDIFDTIPSLGTPLFVSPDGNGKLASLKASSPYLLSMRAKCSNGNPTAWVAVKFNTLCDTSALPYTENFTNNTFPCIANGPWFNNGNGIAIQPNSGQPQSGWFFTKRFFMNAGTTYRVYFKFMNYGSSSPSFTLQMSSYQDTSSFVGAPLLSSVLNTQYPASLDTFALFTPSVSGFYCAGFNSTANSSTGTIVIPQIQVLQNPASPACTSNILPVANAIQPNCNNFQFTWHSVLNANAYTVYTHHSRLNRSGVMKPNPPSDTTIRANFCGNPGDTTTWYVVPRYLGQNATGCATTATYFIMQNVVPPANDLCSNAQTLTVTKGFCSNPVKGSLLGATFSNPSDTVGICLPPNPMPPGSDTADVWYKLIIPATGNAVVQLSKFSLYTMRSAIIRAFTGSCGSLTPVACMIDSGQYYAIEPYRARLYLTNRTPGETIFLRVSSSLYTGDLFTIGAFDTTASQNPAIASNPNTCTPALPVTMDSLSGNLFMWNPLFAANGQIIGEINPDGSSLGTVNASAYVNNGPLRTSNGIPYLDRNIQVTSTMIKNPGQIATLGPAIRLYATQAEINTYNTAIGDPAINDFNVWSNQDNCGSSVINGGNSLGNIFDNGGYSGNNYYLTTYDTTFGSFYFYKGARALPLHVISFTAQKCNTNEVCLNWTTANEINVNNIIIERSADGTSFSQIAAVNALNRITTNYYSAEDKQPLDGVNYYRLKIVDLDGHYNYSEIVTVKFQYPQSIEIAPNPANSFINIHATQAMKRIYLLTGEGQVIKALANQGTSATISISMYASGLYYVRIETASGVVVKKISIVR